MPTCPIRHSLLLFFLFLLPIASRADNPPSPGPLPLKLMSGEYFSDVKAEAQLEAVNGPVQGNSPITLPAHLTFSGTVTADASSNHLAIFSDDGCDVYVDGVLEWNAKDKPQALPDLPNSLHELPLTLTPGTHTVELDYSNIIYSAPDPLTQQPTDIDGVTLFQYTGPDVVVSASSDKSAICAGGWTPTYQYQYLQKETGNVVSRAKPDPHIATVTAAVTDHAGNPLTNQTVTFSWSMPAVDGNGNEAPIAESHTVTTDNNGNTTHDVTSGNEVASGISITATCQGVTNSTSLAVQAPNAAWFYQDDSGVYQSWDGTIYGLNSDETVPTSLEAVLTFNNALVIGHQMSWLISDVVDKGGNEVQPDANGQFSGYGHFSGPISTTDSSGTAKATFTRGISFGGITTDLEDLSVYVPQSQEPQAQTLSTSSTHPHVTPSYGQNSDLALYWKKHKSIGYYTWVQGSASLQNFFSYPAPSGEEDDELLPETRTCVQNIALANFHESTTGNRGQKPGYQIAHSWWFSQVIGMDQSSGGYHKADMTWTDQNGSTFKFGAAFDIVLSDIDIYNSFPNNSDGSENTQVHYAFKPYVEALRDAGIVCWHRWTADAGGENEMHCIDSACLGPDTSLYPPLLKPVLINQIQSYVDGGSGSSNYSLDYPPTADQKTNFLYMREGQYFTIKTNHPGIASLW